MSGLLGRRAMTDKGRGLILTASRFNRVFDDFFKLASLGELPQTAKTAPLI